MKIETETRDDHQVKLIAEIEPEVYEKSKRQAARKIAQTTKIPGFRPGKAPFEVVRRMVGEKALQEEALDILVDEIYPQAIKEAGINPSGPGALEEIVSIDPVKFSFLIPLAPTVKLGDYSSVRLPYEPTPVTDEQIDQFIERLRTSYSTVTPAERPSQEGDMVYLTISGSLVHPEEGKDPSVIEERPLQVMIRPTDQQNEEEWPFPGFARELIGLSADEEKTISHTFSEDSHYETLTGKEIEFQVKVTSVKGVELPEVNDEFAQTLGEFQNMEALRSSIRTGLENNGREEYDRDYYAKLIDMIGADAEVQYPPQMLQEEIDSLLRSLEKDLADQKMDLETYLKVRETDRETFIENEIKPAAIKRLVRSLLMDEVAHTENLELGQQELDASFNETMYELQSSGDFDKLRKKVPSKRLANAVATEAALRALNRRVLERLKAIATGQAEEEASVAQVTPAAEDNPNEEPAAEDTASEQAEASPQDNPEPPKPEN
ncbi:MAG: trigger factor [Chloroflexi bacterium]|nr:trigger factor [Chloroflexota bacterium]